MNKLLFNMALLTGREDWLCHQFDKGTWTPNDSALWRDLYKRQFFKLAVKVAPSLQKDEVHPMPYWATYFDRLPEKEGTPQECCLMEILRKWEEEIGLDALKNFEVADPYSRWSTYLHEFATTIRLEPYIQNGRPHFWAQYLKQPLEESLPRASNAPTRGRRL